MTFPVIPSGGKPVGSSTGARQEGRGGMDHGVGMCSLLAGERFPKGRGAEAERTGGPRIVFQADLRIRHGKDQFELPREVC